MNDDTDEKYRSCDETSTSNEEEEEEEEAAQSELFLSSASSRLGEGDDAVARGRCNGISNNNASYGTHLHPEDVPSNDQLGQAQFRPKTTRAASAPTSSGTASAKEGLPQRNESAITIPLYLPMDKRSFELKYSTYSQKKSGKSARENIYLFLEHPSGWIGFTYHFTVYLHICLK